MKSQFPIIVLFEGVDCSGKDSVIREIHKLTNRIVCVNRFTGSHIVYPKMKLRNIKVDTEEEDFYKLERRLKIRTYAEHLPILLVYLYAHPNIIERRIKEKGEKDITKKSQAIQLMKYYDDYYKKTTFKKIKIDTSTPSSKEIAKTIYKYVKSTFPNP